MSIPQPAFIKQSFDKTVCVCCGNLFHSGKFSKYEVIYDVHGYVNASLLRSRYFFDKPPISDFLFKNNSLKSTIDHFLRFNESFEIDECTVEYKKDRFDVDGIYFHPYLIVHLIFQYGDDAFALKVSQSVLRENK